VKTHSYWLDTAPAGADYSNVEVPNTADVAVVGGGLTGLSTAIHVARKGASVALFEKERIGWGASGRNGGMATTGLAVGISTLTARFDLDTSRRMFQAYNAAVDLVEQLVREESIECHFSRWGKLTLASKPAHFADLVATHEMLARDFGHPTTVVPRSELKNEIDTSYYHGGLVDRLGAGLHVGKFVRGLATVAARLGVRLIEQTPVLRLQRISGHVHDVHTSRGTTRASQVLVGTDGYTGFATPWHRRRIIPVGSFIIVTEPLGRALASELMPTGRMASDTKNLLFYFRLTPDDRLLFGGRAQYALSGPAANLKSARILRQGMLEVFPQLSNVQIDYAWGGDVGLTMDRLCHAGEHEGLYYSLGYNGHGVQMSTYMGKQMAEVMAGTPEANPWYGLPFPAVPLHFGPPWFLPFADLYYRIKDAVA
jgi:glycine/D-amino acid oxidase-like deaminating enzyme